PIINKKKRTSIKKVSACFVVSVKHLSALFCVGSKSLQKKRRARKEREMGEWFCQYCCARSRSKSCPSMNVPIARQKSWQRESGKMSKRQVNTRSLPHSLEY